MTAEREELLIWWLDGGEVDATLTAVMKFGMYDFPEYVKQQLRSLSGRNGRGRLWFGLEGACPDVDEDCFSSIVGRLCETRGGIVICSTDYGSVRTRMGYVTNFKLQSLNLDKAHRA